MKIEVRGLQKLYHDAGNELAIIQNLDFDFQSGMTYSIVGRSGIGKSTLLHILGGLLKASTGSVRYGDTDLCGLGADKLASFRGKHVGFIFQFHHLLPEFSALENVEMPLIISGQPADEATEAARTMLERVGLKDRMSHRPSQLSGGELQRVAIARAVVSKPGVLLADEPTGNLDVETARSVQSLLIDIAKSVGSTVIVVTHNAELARSMQVVVEMMPGGKLQQVQ